MLQYLKEAIHFPLAAQQLRLLGDPQAHRVYRVICGKSNERVLHWTKQCVALTQSVEYGYLLRNGQQAGIVVCIGVSKILIAQVHQV